MTVGWIVVIAACSFYAGCNFGAGIIIWNSCRADREDQ